MKFTPFHVLGMKHILETAVVIWTFSTAITVKMQERFVSNLVSVSFSNSLV